MHSDAFEAGGALRGLALGGGQRDGFRDEVLWFSQPPGD